MYISVRLFALAKYGVDYYPVLPKICYHTFLRRFILFHKAKQDKFTFYHVCSNQKLYLDMDSTKETHAL